MEASSWHSPARSEVMRYLMILRAATDFGLSSADVLAVAGRFNPQRPRCAELANALADLILTREDQAGC